MFDFSKITDLVGEWMSGNGAAEVMQQAPLTELLERVGVDPAMLEGLSTDQVAEHLQSLAANSDLAPEISSALEQFGVNGDMSSLIENLKGGGGPG